MKLATLCYVKNNENNTTLMLHRVKKDNDIHKDKWNGLGGKFEPGETPEDCVIREIEEESGLIIRNPKLKGLLTFPAFDGIEDWYVFVFVAEDFSGKLIDSKEGVLEWIKNEELLNLPLWEGDQIFLNWFDRNSLFSAKFNYSEGKLIDYTVSFY